MSIPIPDRLSDKEIYSAETHSEKTHSVENTEKSPGKNPGNDKSKSNSASGKKVSKNQKRKVVIKVICQQHRVYI